MTPEITRMVEQYAANAEVLYVKSNSKPDVWHRVVKTMDGVPVACTCAGWRWKKTCRHAVIAAVVSAVDPTANADAGE